MLAEYDNREAATQGTRAPRVGDTVVGRIVVITNDSVFVDLGAKAEGLLDRAELVDKDGKLPVAVGDTIEAHVASVKDGNIVLRTRLGAGTGAAAELSQAKQLGIPVEGKVAAVNKGGVEVTVAGLRAFCPMSQLDAGYVEDPATYVGRTLEFLVSDIQTGRGDPNVVLSRRALLEQEKAKRAAETRARLAEGVVVKGTVSTIKKYGAFVDIGGIEGMLHISELGFGHVDHPGEVLEVGETIDVQIIKLEATDDPKRPERVGLSLKALKQDPWSNAGRSFTKSKRVKGQVVRLEPFGAFVAVGDGMEGLVHVSEMVADRRVNHPREVLSVGQTIEAVVLEVDTEKRRLSLSMKAVAAQQEQEQADSYQPAGSGSMGTFADLMKKKLGK